MNATFWDLTETITNSNEDTFLPDVWSKTADATRNRVTESHTFYEWQDPNKKVQDAVNIEGYLGVESVCKDGEYVVALVKKGEDENGFPIGMSQSCTRDQLINSIRHSAGSPQTYLGVFEGRFSGPYSVQSATTTAW